LEETTGHEQRRSGRINLKIRVIVQGTSQSGHSILEETQTLDVSAHGTFLLLKTLVVVRQILIVRNCKTHEEMISRVVRVARNEAGEMAAGLAFMYPSARFWQIAVPPKDWSLQIRPT
jgi:hypothetical protein